MKKVVRPKDKDATFYDSFNRPIKYDKKGVEVTWNTFMSRLYKEGGLEVQQEDKSFLAYGEEPKKKKGDKK
jgi:hypothetical protein